MTVELTDEEYETLRAPILIAVGGYGHEDVVPLIKAERAAKRVVDAVDARRDENANAQRSATA